MHCKICDNVENNALFRVREMMFGYRDEFDYFQCSKCNCLQIADFPPSMAKYYPSDYYSLHSSDQNTSWYSSLPGSVIDLSSLLEVQRDPSKQTKITQKVVDYYLSKTPITRTSKILDIGCGDGSFLRALHEIGFTNVLGVDLYIQEDITYEDGVSVIKGEIYDLEPEWDLVMFHHSFEHMPDPLGVLDRGSRLLSSNGVCLIRMPTVPSFAWEHYGVNWIDLDAPRHFFLHSIDSLNILANKSHLRLIDIIYDSTGFQFWGSEQYARDIPLYSDRSLAVNFNNSIFPLEAVSTFEQQAQRLNEAGQGDQAAFYLAKDV